MGESDIAGIVANATDCTFINCTNNGTLNCGKDYAAGIAAETYGNMVFIGCRNNGDITANGLSLGGIVGFTNDKVTINSIPGL